MAMDGVDSDAMGTISKLSQRAIANSLAQVLEPRDREDLQKAAWFSQVAHMLPDDLAQTTYRDVQQVRMAMRIRQTTSQIDTIATLRSKLVNTALQMVAHGAVTRWQDVVSGLRVIGVPQAAPVAASPAHAVLHQQAGSKGIPEYVYDHLGNLVRNPAYDAATQNSQVNQVGVGSLVINLSDLRRESASLSPEGSTTVVLNPNNEIVGLNSGGVERPLENMKVTELRRLAHPEKFKGSEDTTLTDVQIRMANAVNLPSVADIESALLDEFE